MYFALICALSLALAILQYPTRPPGPPTPSPTPMTEKYSPTPRPPDAPTAPPRTGPGAPRPNAGGRSQAPTGSLAGPLAKLSWLLGHWTCSNGSKLYFSSSQGGYALIEQLDSPTLRAAARLTLERGHWFYSGSAATTNGNSPFQLSGDVVDVDATYMDLKGELVMPSVVLPTRFVRHQRSSNSFTDMVSVYVGGNWQATPSRTCKRA
jgi:hypothetical protein